MKDYKSAILHRLYERLSGAPFKVHSVIPLNTDKPFIFIGEVQASEQMLKGRYKYSGSVIVELYTGTLEYTGSITKPLEWLNNMRTMLHIRKGDKLDLKKFGLEMVYWVLDSDTGLTTWDESERMYHGQLLYRFDVVEEVGYIDRVLTDGGVIVSANCTLPWHWIPNKPIVPPLPPTPANAVKHNGIVVTNNTVTVTHT